MKQQRVPSLDPVPVEAQRNTYEFRSRWNSFITPAMSVFSTLIVFGMPHTKCQRIRERCKHPTLSAKMLAVVRDPLVEIASALTIRSRDYGMVVPLHHRLDLNGRVRLCPLYELLLNERPRAPRRTCGRAPEGWGVFVKRDNLAVDRQMLQRGRGGAHLPYRSSEA